MAQNQKSGLHSERGQERPVQWAAPFNRTPAPSVTPPAGPPMTLGNVATARVRLIVWCKEYRHPGRARPRCNGRKLRCRDDGTGVARAAAVLAMRGRNIDHGGDWCKSSETANRDMKFDCQLGEGRALASKQSTCGANLSSDRVRRRSGIHVRRCSVEFDRFASPRTVAMAGRCDGGNDQSQRAEAISVRQTGARRFLREHGLRRLRRSGAPWPPRPSSTAPRRNIRRRHSSGSPFQ
jgi:hypothetical protein